MLIQTQMHIKCKLKHKYSWNVNSKEIQMHVDIYQSNNCIQPLVAGQGSFLQPLHCNFNSKSYPSKTFINKTLCVVIFTHYLALVSLKFPPPPHSQNCLAKFGVIFICSNLTLKCLGEFPTPRFISFVI
jgi:hypothetical protein